MSLNFLRDIGNNHVELSRLLWAASVLAGIGYSGWHLHRSHIFSIIEFGTGMGLLLAGGGGATALKDTFVARAKASAAQGGE